MIEIKKLRKAYDKPILEDVDCEFPRRRVTLLMGANGAGKTTLFKCVLGLESYGGAIRFDGRPLDEVRSQVMAVFDEPSLYRQLSGWRNLQLLADGSQLTREVAAQMFGGSEARSVLRRPVRGYSSGQRKRLALTLARSVSPAYVLLDEIASGLDVESMDQAANVIRDMSRGAAVVLTGHQFDFYARVVDRVVVLNGHQVKEVQWDGGSGIDLEAIYRRDVMAAAS